MVVLRPVISNMTILGSQKHDLTLVGVSEDVTEQQGRFEFVQKSSRIGLCTPLERFDGAMREMFKDEKLMAHIPMLYNMSEDAMQKRRSGHREDYKSGSSCFFDVVELSSGKLIGTSGFRSVDREQSEAEWGIIIATRCQRKGLAAECLSMCNKHAKTVLKVGKIIANTSAKNAPMIAFLKSMDLRPPVNGRRITAVLMEMMVKKGNMGEIRVDTVVFHQ